MIPKPDTAAAQTREELLATLLKQARPNHYAAECVHCGIDELPEADCPWLKFTAAIDSALAPPAAPSQPTAREVRLGVVEFHPNPDLRARFYTITDDLQASGAIVDVWLMDIATVLSEFGYRLRVTTEKPTPTATLPTQEPSR